MFLPKLNGIVAYILQSVQKLISVVEGQIKREKVGKEIKNHLFWHSETIAFPLKEH